MKKYEKEFGKQFVKEYTDFAKAFEKAAFDVGKDGMPVLKPEYR
jgi:hypothetical protein